LLLDWCCWLQQWQQQQVWCGTNSTPARAKYSCMQAVMAAAPGAVLLPPLLLLLLLLLQLA
jgi:hypothetical protein